MTYLMIFIYLLFSFFYVAAWNSGLLKFLCFSLVFFQIRRYKLCLNSVALVYMIIMGLGAAASTRISNELGAKNPKAVRFAVLVVVSMTVVEGFVVGTILLCIQNVWGRTYSKEVEVVKKVASILPLVALSHFLDGTQCVLAGIARGCGWQKICALINLASYYLVEIPISVILAFVLHLETKESYVHSLFNLSSFQ